MKMKGGEFIMKKILLLVLSLVLVLTSCGGAGGDTSDTSGEGNNGENEAKSAYTFKVQSADSFEVKIDQDMSEVLKALGEPLKYFEAASCAFDGLDKTYTYNGFEITTRPDGDKDYVNSIILTDDSVTTAKGVYIGMKAEDVIAKYGEATQSDTLISYKDGNTVLNFILKNGSVISIDYVPAE